MAQIFSRLHARADARDPYTRWNFGVIVTEAALFMSGLAWIEPSTVLPLFIGHLTPSTVIVGLITLLQRLGWLLPSVFMAAVLGHRPHRLPWLRWPVLLGRIPLLGFVLYLWFFGVERAALTIWLMVFSLFAISLGNGVLSIPWQDIIAKSIPSQLRGRFFGAMQFCAAVATFAVGFVVRWMLGPAGPGYPRDYTLLFTLMGLFMALSALGCWLVREPLRPVLDRPQPLREILLGALPTARANPAFGCLVLVSLFGFGVSFAMPFYMVFAKQRLAVPEHIAGVYIWTMTLGSATASLWWAHLNDRRGPRAVLRGASLLITATPLLALTLLGVSVAAPDARGIAHLFSLVFLVGGCAMGGTWMGATNYLFELASDRDRPRYIASMNLLSSPGALVPLLIGWLLGFLPFTIVFALMAGSGATAAAISLRMPIPRPTA